MYQALGILCVNIKYTYFRGSTTIYQRAVPSDLRDRYAGPNHKVDLKTTDPLKVAREVLRLNRLYEAEWAALRASPESSPQSLKAHAVEYLKGWGLEPGNPNNHPVALELLHAHIDGKREAHAREDMQVYEDVDASEYLTPVEIEAGRLLHHAAKPTVSDLRDTYIATHRKRDDAGFLKRTALAFDSLLAITGNKEIAAFGREDARTYIAARLEAGKKTATVRRWLRVFSAAWSAYARETEQDTRNPFSKLSIPGEGTDSEERTGYSSDQLAALSAACRAADDDPRWLFALMVDTGARVSEVAGLALDDLRLTHAVPHMVIRVHPWRSLKNKNSAREVPLVGTSLWAARRVVETATQGQVYAFPRYTKDRKGVVSCASDSASATLLKWLRAQKIEGLNHELRHTMADRLRAVQCPKPIIQSVVGHGDKDMTDSYGVGYDLGVKLEWLRKVVT